MNHKFLQTCIWGKGLSQDQLAAYLNISPQTLNLFLSGVLKFNEQHQDKLCTLLGYSPKTLFS